MILAWWALAARGADVAEEADHLFQLGVRDYAAGAYEDALGHLLESYRLAPNRNVQFNIARIYEQLGKKDLAWRHYHEYVEATPDATARADGEAALARLDKDVARVKVTSLPSGATVYVGRADLGARGVTPITLALPPGKRAILVDLDGYVLVETTADLVSGKESRTAVELLPVPATASSTAGVAPFQAVVRAGAEVVVEVDAARCAILPSRAKGAGAPRAAPGPLPTPPGSLRAASAPLPPLALDVTVAGVTARTELERLDKPDLVLEDSADLRAWVFDRCTPTEGKPGSLGAAIAAVPSPARSEVVTVFAEWAAARGSPDIGKAAASCIAGECGPLAGALLSR